MAKKAEGQVTQLLLAWSQGDRAALDQLIPLVYDELRRQARQYMRRERSGHTLQTTALVNEVYLRLIHQEKVDWQNRNQFFAICAKLMRRILVDYARQRQTAKREGEAHHVSLEETAVVSKEPSIDLIALDVALVDLETMDPQKSQIVELRFFGGLTTEEIAEVLHISPRTVERQWRAARAWLYHQIKKSEK